MDVDSLTVEQRRGYKKAAELWNQRATLAVPFSDETLSDEDLAYAAKNTIYRKRMRRTDLPDPSDPSVYWISGAVPVSPAVVPGTKDRRKRSSGTLVPATSARCGVWIEAGPLRGKRCPRFAGESTPHYGAGTCGMHRGNRAYERALGAWLMAHGFAQQLDVSPWEALLLSVRIAAGKVAYIESVLATAKSDLELEGRAVDKTDGLTDSGASAGVLGRLLVHPDTGEPLGVGEYRDLSWWVDKGEYWHAQMARCAKMAIDAGIAQWMVEKVEKEAATIARVLNDVIAGLGDRVTEDQAMEMRALMSQSLLRIDEEQRLVAIEEK